MYSIFDHWCLPSIWVISFTFVFSVIFKTPNHFVLDLISFWGFRERFTAPTPPGYSPQATQNHVSKTKFTIFPLPVLPEQRVGQPNKQNHLLCTLGSFPSLSIDNLSSKIPLISTSKASLRVITSCLFP